MLAFDLQRVREKAVSTDIVGYEVEDLQGTIGEVDRTTEELVPSFISVDTLSSLTVGRVTLPAAVIERIDHGARKIYVDRRHKEIRNAPESSDDETDRGDGYLGELRRYYGPGGAGYRPPRDAWTEAFQRAFGGDRIDEAAQRREWRTFRERVRIPERSRPYLLLALAAYVVTFVALLILVPGPPGQGIIHAGLVPAVVVAAFFLETMDSAAGMGFGTTMGVLLFLLGYAPKEAVPALLAANGLVGTLAGRTHNQFRNVEFRWPPNNATKALMLIAGCSSAGAIIAVSLAYFAVPLPKTAIKTWVAIAAILLGAGALARNRMVWARKYRPRRLALFAAFAGVNKGVGSGGHGIATLGALLSGIHEKSSTAITTTAEGLASSLGALTFLIFSSLGAKSVHWGLLPSLWIGAFPAAIIGPYAMRAFPTVIWRYLIPFYSIVIGSVLLVVLYVFGGS
jgi:uncharacterized membrane protein YfcA